MKLGFYEKLSRSDEEKNPIRLKRLSTFNSIYAHWHETVELLYFTEGQSVVFCDDREYTVDPGDIVFVNPMETHRGICLTKKHAWYVLHISPLWFDLITDREFIYIENRIRDEGARALMESLIKEEEEKAYGYETAIKRDAFALLTYLLRHHTERRVDLKEQPRHIEHKRLLNDVLNYIHHHYDETLTVSALAARFYISPSHLSHLFKEQLGKGVTAYCNEHRIGKAKMMLLSDKSPITEVAHAAGFDDINYFSRVFKKLVGKTPSEFRACQ